MALRFYFDTHIARAVADQLRRRGVDVTRCEEVGMAEADDEVLLQYATDQKRIMVTLDADFLDLDQQWRQTDRAHGGIMKVDQRYQGDAQIGHLVKQLLFYDEAERAGAVDYASEIANHVLYL